MKKILYILVLVSFLIPSFSEAQVASSDVLKQELIKKLEALVISLTTQLQELLAQKGSVNTNVSTSTAVSSVNVDKGVPYQGQNGNWYYPNAFNSDGSALQVPSVSINGSTAINIYSNLTKAGELFDSPVQTFVISNQTHNSQFKKLIAHFIINGNVRITTAYLYQGNNIPLASTKVSKDNVATFIIPTGTIGSALGINIPTQFTIKADLADITTRTTGCWEYKYDIYKHINVKTQYHEGVEVSPFSIKSVIKPTEVYLYDDSNNEVKIVDKTKVTDDTSGGSLNDSNSNMCDNS